MFILTEFALAIAALVYVVERLLVWGAFAYDPEMVGATE